MRERRRGEEEAMMNRYRQILALLLCAALFFAAAVPGFAEDASAEKPELPDAEAQAGPAEEVPEEKPGLLDDAALTGLVEGFLQERGIPCEHLHRAVHSVQDLLRSPLLCAVQRLQGAVQSEELSVLIYLPYPLRKRIRR